MQSASSKKARESVALSSHDYLIFPEEILNDNVLGDAMWACARLVNRGRRIITISTDDLYHEALTFACSNGFAGYGSLSKSQQKEKRDDLMTHLWHIANMRDAAFYKNQIIEQRDPKFIRDFFYSSKDNASIIQPICKTIMSHFLKFGISLSLKEIESYVCESAFGSGNWKQLDQFRGETNIFDYLKTCSIRFINEELRRNGIIPKKKSKKSDKLDEAPELHAIDHWTPGQIEHVLAEVVTSSDHRRVLRLRFVDHLKLPEIASKLNVAEKVAVEKIKKAVAHLCDCLSRYPEPLNLTVNLKAKDECPRAISMEDLPEAVAMNDEEDIVTDVFLAELREYYGFDYSAEELGLKLVELIRKAERLANMSDFERDVWELRYWQRMDARKVAEKLNCPSSRIHTVYCNLNVRIARICRRLLCKD